MSFLAVWTEKQNGTCRRFLACMCVTAFDRKRCYEDSSHKKCTCQVHERRSCLVRGAARLARLVASIRKYSVSERLSGYLALQYAPSTQLRVRNCQVDEAFAQGWRPHKRTVSVLFRLATMSIALIWYIWYAVQQASHKGLYGRMRDSECM